MNLFQSKTFLLAVLILLISYLVYKQNLIYQLSLDDVYHPKPTYKKLGSVPSSKYTIEVEFFDELEPGKEENLMEVVKSFERKTEEEHYYRYAVSTSKNNFLELEEKIVLRYFPIRGRSEPIRMMLFEMGCNFTDIRYTNPDEWNVIKQNLTLFPFSQVPQLSIGDVSIVQSAAIAKYVGQLGGFYSDDILEQAKIDSIYGCVEDFKKRFTRIIYSRLDGVQLERQKRYYLNIQIKDMLEKFEHMILRENKNNIDLSNIDQPLINIDQPLYLVNTKKSIADFYLYELISIHLKILSKDNLFLGYPLIRNWFENIDHSPIMNIYKKSKIRPMDINGYHAKFLRGNHIAG